MDAVRTTIFYLEMCAREELRPSTRSVDEFAVAQAREPYPALNRFFYQEIGRDYLWTDRLSWPEERWRAWVARPQLQTWIGYHRGTPCGYFELEAQPRQQIELAYFGLLPPFMGQGLGGLLLTEAVLRAWSFDVPDEPGAVKRVWVHTCTLDHPAALQNYRSRGFRIYHQEESMQPVERPS